MRLVGKWNPDLLLKIYYFIHTVILFVYYIDFQYRIMKDKKYSDTSDAFICDVLSKKCSQFFNTVNSRYFMEVSQTLKYSKTHMQETKTIVSQNKLIYSDTITHQSISKINKYLSIDLKPKQEQLLKQLKNRIIQNVKIQFEEVINDTNECFSQKDKFHEILEIMDEEYHLINDELARVKRYTKRKQIRDVINFNIDHINPKQFVQIILTNVDSIRQYFLNYKIQIFSNYQLQQLRQCNDLVEQLVDIDGLIERRDKQKKQRKKNRKKKNKQRSGSYESTNEGELDKQNGENSSEQIKVAEYLKNLVFDCKERSSCYFSDDWITKLKNQVQGT